MVSQPSRAVVSVLLVVVGGLLVVSLYKMGAVTSFLQEQWHGKSLHTADPTFPQPLRREQSPLQTSLQRLQLPTPMDTINEALRGRLESTAPLLKTRAEQEKAGHELHQRLTREPLPYSCKDKRTITNRVEGAWSYCADAPFALKKPCLVYSFGINYDFTFDDAMGALGCEVISFDPSMQDTPDHRRSPSVMFYQIGLLGHNTDRFTASWKNKQFIWKMRTLKTLVQELKHSDRTIDILKVDIELSEWPAVRNMIDSGVLKQVKQFLVEWHIFKANPPREMFSQLITLLKDLKKAGFQAYHRRPCCLNLNWENFNVQSDFGYINVNFTHP